MKITISKIILFLQAIVLLAGFPVVGMKNNSDVVQNLVPVIYPNEISVQNSKNPIIKLNAIKDKGEQRRKLIRMKNLINNAEEQDAEEQGRNLAAENNKPKFNVSEDNLIRYYDDSSSDSEDEDDIIDSFEDNDTVSNLLEKLNLVTKDQSDYVNNLEKSYSNLFDKLNQGLNDYDSLINKFNIIQLKISKKEIPEYSIKEESDAVEDSIRSLETKIKDLKSDFLANKTEYSKEISFFQEKKDQVLVELKKDEERCKKLEQVGYRLILSSLNDQKKQLFDIDQKIQQLQEIQQLQDNETERNGCYDEPDEANKLYLEKKELQNKKADLEKKILENEKMRVITAQSINNLKIDVLDDNNKIRAYNACIDSLNKYISLIDNALNTLNKRWSEIDQKKELPSSILPVNRKSFDANAFKKEMKEKAKQFKNKKRKKENIEYVKQIPGKAVDKAYEAVAYISQTPVVNNSLVNTIMALGKAGFNAAVGLAQKTEDTIRTNVDLVGFNVEQNVFSKLEQALSAFKEIGEDNLGSFVINNQDIPLKYVDSYQKVRAMGAVLEYMKPASTINDAQVKTYMQEQKNIYAPIKKDLEDILSQSYAEIKHKHTLVDALNSLLSKTENTVKSKIAEFKTAVDTNFAKFIEEKRQINVKDVQEQASIHAQIEQYQKIQQALYFAADLYNTVFLIDARLTDLLSIENKYINIAIDIYTDYKDWLSKYKALIADLNNNVGLLEDHAEQNTGADLIIKLHEASNKNASDIVQLMEHNISLLKEYFRAYIFLPSIVNDQQAKSMQSFEELTKYFNMFITTDEVAYLTKAQSDKINTLATELGKKYKVLDQAFFLATQYTNQHYVQFILNEYNKMKKLLSAYKEQGSNDDLEDISVEDLTINRSEGIKKLFAKHRSARKMITWAEEKQVEYEKRQKRRFAILGTGIESDIKELVRDALNLDIDLKDEQLNCFDKSCDDTLRRCDFANNLEYTTKHQIALKAIIEAAYKDAKNFIKIAIIAGWTVIGVEAKMAFEGLANTKGSDAKSVVKRGLGKALNAVRKGLIGTGKKIAEKEYHKKTRKKIAEKAKKIAKEAKNLGSNAVDFIANEWHNGAQGRKDLLANVENIFTEAKNAMSDTVTDTLKAIKTSWKDGKQGRDDLSNSIKQAFLDCDTQIDEILQGLKQKWAEGESHRALLLVEAKNQVLGIVYGIPTVVLTPINAIGEAWDHGYEARQQIAESIEEKLTQMKQAIVDGFNNAIDALKRNCFESDKHDDENNFFEVNNEGYKFLDNESD
ncbi:hypothetical protein EKK58_04610 [Candidatus Dependentiae bacterium]|nr:MAG: hypothetical protein EKK58_04610 [Candidatus Dependentiae bacterium]